MTTGEHQQSTVRGNHKRGAFSYHARQLLIESAIVCSNGYDSQKNEGGSNGWVKYLNKGYPWVWLLALPRCQLEITMIFLRLFERPVILGNQLGLHEIL